MVRSLPTVPVSSPTAEEAFSTLPSLFLTRFTVPSLRRA